MENTVNSLEVYYLNIMRSFCTSSYLCLDQCAKGLILIASKLLDSRLFIELKFVLLSRLLVTSLLLS